MLEFFMRQPLWAKAAIVAGTGAVGYYGYKWMTGPSKHGEVPRGGMGPIEAAAALPPTGAMAPPVSAAAPQSGVVAVEAFETISPPAEWDEVYGMWVSVPEHERHRRFQEYFTRQGIPAPAVARPAPPMMRPGTPMPPFAHPGFPGSPMARPAPPMARPAPPSLHHVRP